MMTEQLLRLFSGVFVGIYVARYLGPDQFGALSYVLTISALLIGVSRMGMDSVLTRDLVQKPDRKKELMGTAFWIMTITAAICYALTATTIYNIQEDNETKLYALIVAGSTFFTSFLVIDFYFQSQIQAKYSSLCKSTSLIITSSVKVALIFYKSNLIWFVVITALEQAILATFLIIVFSRTNLLTFFFKFNTQDAKEMLTSCWPMVISSVAILIYMRIDQIMIRHMLGLREVGIYSAAAKLFDAWFLLPYTLTISLLPIISKLKQENSSFYKLRLTQFFSMIIWTCMLVAIITTFTSEYIIKLSFGDEYKEAALVLTIMMWTAVFSATGSVSARYFSAERMEKKIATRTIASAILNIILNFVLIPIYGIIGAAIATLTCTIFANYLIDWLDKDLKDLLKIKHNALLFRHQLKDSK
ncbi:flippase [Pseudomonas sp. FW305-70]|nr:flippase [Pseudomonas sp. FW305-70]